MSKSHPYGRLAFATNAELQKLFYCGKTEWNIMRKIDNQDWYHETWRLHNEVVEGRAFTDSLGDGEYASMPDIAYGDGSDAETLEWHRNVGVNKRIRDRQADA